VPETPSNIKNLHFQLTWTHLSWNPTLPALPLPLAMLLALAVTAGLGLLMERW